jgi:drug/metabolite transporter (DMT)-like permease
MRAALRQFEALPAPLKAGLLMFAAGMCSAVMNCLIRFAAEELHALQVTFFRNFFGFLFVLPWLATQGGLRLLRTRRLPRIALGASINIVSMVTFFIALIHMPIAEAIALNFAKPLFATAGAALFLHEVVRARRWTATCVGFLGVMIVLQPGIQTISPYAWLVLISTATFAAVTLMIKDLTRTEPISTIVLYQFLFMAAFSAGPALFVWTNPSLLVWGYSVLLGLLGTIGWLAFTRAFALADASAVLPYDFLRLPATALIAYLLFGEVPSIWLWVGGTVIFGSTVYIAHRETKLASNLQAAQAGVAGMLAPPSPAAKP